MGDWGKKIRIQFSDNILGFNATKVNTFSLFESLYNSHIHPINMVLETPNCISLEFVDFNDLIISTLEYDGLGGIRGVDFDIDAFEIVPTIQGLRTRYNLLEYVELVGEASGRIRGIETVNSYLLDGYVSFNSLASGTVNNVIYQLGYLPDGYVSFNTYNAGVVCDINGIPL